MNSKETLHRQFEQFQKTIKTIASEEYDPNNSMSRSVSPAGVKIYNKLAKRFNSSFGHGGLELFPENTTPNSVLHPKLQEIEFQVGIALDHMSGFRLEKIMEIEPVFTRRIFSAHKQMCFVLMPFRDKLRPIFDDHIKKVCKKFSIDSVRADDVFTTTAIMEDVWEKICCAQFIIAELTDRNPNVFYELGIAHTLGKSAILITQNMDDVPFDLRHLRAIHYEYTPRGMERFEQNLENTIGSIVRSAQ